MSQNLEIPRDLPEIRHVIDANERSNVLIVPVEERPSAGSTGVLQHLHNDETETSRRDSANFL